MVERAVKGMKQVSGIVNSRRNLESLLDALHTRGFSENDISIVMSEKTRNLFFNLREETKAPEGASLGVLSGGLLGALIGGLTAVGNLVVPGIGLLAAGPLMGALAGGAIGGATGGIIGALIGAGIPEHEARFFQDALKEEGNILVVANAPEEETRETKEVFNRFGAKRVKIHR